jgi:hypothetical protein
VPDRVGRAGGPDTTRARLVYSFCHKIRRAKRPGHAPMGSLCFRTADEFPGRRISPHRLRGGHREEIQLEAPRSRSGRPPQLAQTVCSRSVVALISDCGWGKALPGPIIKGDPGFFDRGCVCHLLSPNKRAGRLGARRSRSRISAQFLPFDESARHAATGAVLTTADPTRAKF